MTTFGKGKTSSEGRRWGRNEASLKYGSRGRFPIKDSSDMGETRLVSYQPSTLRAQLRAIADEHREHRTAENTSRMDALIREAHNIGWTAGEIRAALRAPSSSNVYSSLKRTTPPSTG